MSAERSTPSLHGVDTLEKNVLSDPPTVTMDDSKLELQSTHSASQAQALDVNVRLANPLKAFDKKQVMQRGRDFADRAGLNELRESFAKAALVAQNPNRECFAHGPALVLRTSASD